MLSTDGTASDPTAALAAESGAGAMDAACEIVQGVMLYYSRFDSKVDEFLDQSLEVMNHENDYPVWWQGHAFA
jgi:hypothetical protein